MILYCKEAMPRIHFEKIEEQELEQTRIWLQHRFEYAATIKATTSFHNFESLSIPKIATKRVNSDKYYSYVFDFLETEFFETILHEENDIVNTK